MTEASQDYAGSKTVKQTCKQSIVAHSCNSNTLSKTTSKQTNKQKAAPLFYRYRPVILATQEAEEGEFKIQGMPGLSEFEVSLGNLLRLFQNKNKGWDYNLLVGHLP